jgi:penicillin-binding protein 2
MLDEVVRFGDQDKPNFAGSIAHHRVNRWFAPAPLSSASRVRVWPFVVLSFVVGILLFGRLAQLTVVEGSYRREMADSNRVIALRRAAARGILFDRNQQPLVVNVPIYKRQVPNTTVMQGMFEELTHTEAVELSQNSGERVFFDLKRDYTCGTACATLVGYAAEVDTHDLANNSGYLPGDLIGKAGLERYFERELRGEPGSEMVEVNAKGEMVREIGENYPQAGMDMTLTVDKGLSEVLIKALADRPGAAVAQVPQTGELLALISTPTYDINRVADFLNRDDMPFFNRAIGGAYPPGSIFKIVTAVAGLEEEIIDGEATYEDTGEIVIDQYRYGNWYYDEYGRTEGNVGVVDALRRSNDIFFYKLGGDIGPDTLASWARLFGFESTAGLERLGAVAGTIPDPAWKERTKGERWYLGNTYHMAIGQGDVLVTPLQLNRMVGAVAANGSLCPVILRSGDVGQKPCEQLNLNTQALTLVKEGLLKACQPGGTGVPFFDYEVEVACKTGTAQDGGEDDLPHAWFSAYAPAQNPEIVVTVLLEHAGQGSEKAAPVALEAMEYWFGGDSEIDEKRVFGTQTDQE